MKIGAKIKEKIADAKYLVWDSVGPEQRWEVALDFFTFLVGTILVIGAEKFVQESTTFQNDTSYWSRFARWHGSNLFDVPDYAALFDIAAISVTARTRPLAMAGGLVAVGTAYEGWQSTLPGRSFDTVDVECYAGSALLYVAARKLISRYFLRGPKP